MTQEDVVARLNAECERAWEAYRIAHDQAMSNGEKAQSLSDRIDVRDALLQRACWLMRPYCGGDEALRIFCDDARAALHQEGIAP